MTAASPDGLRSIGVLVRAVAVLLLLAGVLAMHALTSGHGVGLASWSTASAAGPSKAVSVAAGPHSHDAVIGAHDVVTGSTAVTTGALAEDSCAGCEDHRAPAHSGSHLLVVCLAVVAGAALALLLLIGCARRVTLLLAHTSMNVRTAVQPLVGALRPPSLLNLCVLRT